MTHTEPAKTTDAKEATKAHRSFPLELTGDHTNPGRTYNNPCGEKFSLVPNVNFGHVRRDEERFDIRREPPGHKARPEFMHFVRLYSLQTLLLRTRLV